MRPQTLVRRPQSECELAVGKEDVCIQRSFRTEDGHHKDEVGEFAEDLILLHVKAQSEFHNDSSA